MISYVGGSLHIEQVPIKKLAFKYGTPSYIYSKNKIIENYKAYRDAYSKFSPIICYAVKACSNINILKIISNLGAGFECVSEGEYRRTQIADNMNNRIVISGVCKSKAEIEQYIQGNVLHINAESIEEIVAINQISKNYNKITNIGIRINPDVKPNTHEKITTGSKENKFGVLFSDFKESLETIKQCNHLNIESLSFHIGSQIVNIEAYELAYTKIAEILEFIRTQNIHPKYINIGGGVGISYHNQKTINLGKLAQLYNRILSHFNLQLIIEPGRFITGNAGILLSKIISIKHSKECRPFLFIDAGMNDFLRTAMYGCNHKIIPIAQQESSGHVYQIAGPICESSDIFDKNYTSSKPQIGDFIAILDAGAYCASMSSNYNSRPLLCEVLIDKNQDALIRKRQPLEDLFKYELI